MSFRESNLREWWLKYALSQYIHHSYTSTTDAYAQRRNGRSRAVTSVQLYHTNSWDATPYYWLHTCNISTLPFQATSVAPQYLPFTPSSENMQQQTPYYTSNEDRQQRQEHARRDDQERVCVWIIQICDMIYTYMWHGSYICIQCARCSLWWSRTGMCLPLSDAGLSKRLSCRQGRSAVAETIMRQSSCEHEYTSTHTNMYAYAYVNMYMYMNIYICVYIYNICICAYIYVWCT